MPDFVLKYTGEEIEARLDKVPELETGKVSLWDSEKQYAKGDFCIHKGYLWVCTAEAGNKGTEPSTNYNVWNVTYSNPNLLDNPWFTVNQRGQSQYTGAMYTVDRWRTWQTDDVCTVSSNGVSLSYSSTYINFVQYIGLEIRQFISGKTVTASAMDFDGNIYSGTFVVLDNMDSNIVFINGDTRINIYIKQEYNDFQFRISGSMAVNLRAVKLELGEVSTLKNDIAPNYATELLKCQRYFQKDYIHTTRYNSSSSTEAVNVFLKTNMRTVPSIVITECAYWNGSVWTPVNYTIPDQLGSAGYFSCWVNAIPTGQQINIIVRYEASADL